MAILATATSKGRINFCGSRGLLSAKLATFSEKLFPPLHNVYFMQNDVTVSFLAQVLDTGTYFFSLYILRILAFYAPNLVYDTGSYFGGNHGSRV